MKSLFNAGIFLVSDLLSSLIFAGVFALTNNVYLATAIGIGLGLGQIAWSKARGRPIDLMQWMSLGLVLVFGGATLLTHNPLFIKLKPALIYVAVAGVMLKPGWMIRYMPPVATETASDVMVVFGYVWSALMLLTAAATVCVALRFDTRAYAAFLAVFPACSKLVLFGVQYAVTRALIVRRVRKRRELAASLA